ncbi:MAG: SUMF1/EgtB/PvdO family nonheme iron enzyme [Thermodesulfobacteriota bacterium]
MYLYLLSLLLTFWFFACSRPIEPPKDMVLVPAGEFIMGSNEVDREAKAIQYGEKKPRYANERPERNVYLDSFYIDKYEVTITEYKEFVNSTGWEVPEYWRFLPQLSEMGTYPVSEVSWYSAEAYCQWRGKRLPAEAEWEKAARGRDGRRFPWGNDFNPERANGVELRDSPLPVGSFESGKSPYGVYDMAGNVAEWTADWYKRYPGNEYNDLYYGAELKVTRGGSWGSDHYAMEYYMRSSDRSQLVSPDEKYIDIGFRCAKNVR